jgi:lipid-binding SYLF domain-containing protein
MKNFRRAFVAIALAASAGYSIKANAASLADVQSTLDTDTAALSELMANPAESIPRDLLRSAKCVTSLHIVKAGLVWGLRGGSGVVSCRTQSGEWSNPVFIELGAASWGFQIGVEVVDLTLVFTNHDARESFEKGNFTLGAAGGLTAGPMGRELSAGTNYKLEDVIYSYSRTRGLYVGISLEGSVLRPDAESNRALYGSQVPAEIFSSSRETAPSMVQPYLEVLNHYSM